MYEFAFADLRLLAVDLPNEIKFYKYAADFEGEKTCITRWLEKPYLPEGLRKRLQIEWIIADTVRHNYTQTMEDALTQLRQVCPALELSDLRRFVENGWVDHVRRGNTIYFEDDACANIRGTHEKLLYDLCHDVPMTPDPRARLHESVQIQKEKGSDAVRYTVEMTLRPTDEALKPGKPLYVHLPYPAITPEQSEIRLLESSHPAQISDAPVRTAYFEAPLREGECVRVVYTYVNRAVYKPLRPEAVDPVQPAFCTQEEYPHIRFTPMLRELACEIAGDETNPLLKARAAYEWITHHVMYSYVKDYLMLDSLAEYAAINGHGDCGIQALQFITLCRIMGIPAQWQSGCDPDFRSIGSHDWATFYIEPFGWLHCDPSFGGSAWRRQDLILHEHYFGNLDPFRLVTCTRFQQPFIPAQRYLRTDPYDNQRGEAEYAEKPLTVTEMVRTRRIISAERVD